MRRILSLVACSAVALVVTGCASAPQATPMTSVADGSQQSDGVLTAALDPSQPGCSAAVGVEGTVVWAGAVGLADVEGSVPLSTDSVFDLASVSKQFTAFAVLLLEADGLLELDDPLAQHVEELPAWASAITLENLMHHRTGIPDYTPALGVGTDEPAGQSDALDAIAASEPTFDSGARFEYSNSNYVLLAEVVRSVAGEALPDLLDSRVFEPAGLAMRLDPEYDHPLVATPYLPGASGPMASRSPWTQLGDGSVFTNPSELVRWADTYRRDPLGVIETAVDDAEPTGDGSGYGPGLVVGAEGTLSHLGGWSGYGAAFEMSADRSTALAVQCNDGARDPRTIADALATIWGVR